MVLKQKRDNTDILIIDASKGFVKDGKNNKLRACDIKKIVDVVKARKKIERYSRVITKDEIRRNDYNLNISRYVDSSEKAENWDIYATMLGGIPKREINELEEYWSAFPQLKKELFVETDSPYTELAIKDIKNYVENHTDIQQFRETFQKQFSNFKLYLKDILLDQMENMIISQGESNLSDDIFQRLKMIPLVDKYEAYQLLHEDWEKIAVDLEIVQTEGFEATRKVDPNMVIKKKNGKDEEVQDGWAGHVIPFESVQETLLIEETKELKLKEKRLSELPALYEEIAESLSEEEKEEDYFNDGSFVAKEVNKKLKELKKDTLEESIFLAEKLSKVEMLMQEEKKLKSEIKKETVALQNKTKETIESLSDSQVKMLLEKKWIDSLIDNLNKLPENVINTLVGDIKALQKKYEITFFDVEREIRETEQKLALMIDELVGDEFDMKGLGEFKKLLTGE